MRSALLIISCGVVFFAAGCDTTDANLHRPEYVVESYLISGEPIPQVRVSLSQTVQRRYDFTRNAVKQAIVHISLLAPDGSVETLYGFETTEELPGLYTPIDNTALVEAGRTYMLDVDVQGRGDQVTATTIVPGAFNLLRTSADTIQYQAQEQLELDVTRSFYPGRQSVYVFATESLEPTEENLTPFYKDITDDDDIETLRINESPLLNEGNYDINPDGTLTIKLPWIAVAFFGPNRLISNAIDNNLFDFLRSQTIQQGGSTLSPGEIPNVIDHIEGGTGIFGSLSRSQFEVFIAPPPELQAKRFPANLVNN